MAELIKKQAGRPRGGSPKRTIEAREQEIASLALDLARQQILEGKASSQVITHFLKIASTRERVELEKIRHENLLLEARTKQIEESKQDQELYGRVIEALRSYRSFSDAGEENAGN